MIINLKRPSMVRRAPIISGSRGARCSSWARMFECKGDEDWIAYAPSSRNPVLLLAKCLPSWPPSPEIRTARAKFTDFLIFLVRISA